MGMSGRQGAGSGPSLLCGRGLLNDCEILFEALCRTHAAVQLVDTLRRYKPQLYLQFCV